MATPKKKKLRLKPRAMDVLCFICGLVIGEVLAVLTSNVGFLKWLSYDVVFGFEEPLKLTFLIFKFAFGFSIHLNPAVVLFGLLGIFTGRYLLPAIPAQKKASPAESIEADEPTENEEEIR